MRNLYGVWEESSKTSKYRDLRGAGSGPPHFSWLAGSPLSSWDLKDCKEEQGDGLPSGENAPDENGDLV